MITTDKINLIIPLVIHIVYIKFKLSLLFGYHVFYVDPSSDMVNYYT